MARADASDLHIKQQPAFERWEWRAQRVAWLGMALFVAAALAGLLGAGWLSATEIATPDGKLRLEFNRFIHRDSSETIHFRLRPEADAAWAELWLDQASLDRLETESIEPQPESVKSDASGQIFTFRLAKPGAEIRVSYRVRPIGCGGVQGQARLGQGPAITFSQFIFP